MLTYIDPKAKLFGHLDRVLAIEHGESPAPVNVEIDLSNRCSLGCEWCHFAYTHTRGPLTGKRAKPAGATPGGDLMSKELATAIIDQFDDAGVRSITWTGGGEPTLHPNFDGIISFASGFHPAQGLYTHGGHVSEARAGLLKKAMTFVYVSLDAADAAAYKRDKGVDRFEAACAGVRRLADAEGAATIGVGFLITAQNWRDAGRMATLAVGLGADYCQFRPTVLYDADAPGNRSDQTMWMREAIPYLEEVKQMVPMALVDADRFHMYEQWAGHGYQRCYWSQLQMVVTPNGKMWTCVNKREHAGAEIGDLSREKFTAILERRQAVHVNGDCRVMCRGHLPNLAVHELLANRPHKEFI